MKTIVINNTIFILKNRNKIKDKKSACNECIFSFINMHRHDNYRTLCISCPIQVCKEYIVIRKANVFDKIILLFKKKIKK